MLGVDCHQDIISVAIQIVSLYLYCKVVYLIKIQIIIVIIKSCECFRRMYIL